MKYKLNINGTAAVLTFIVNNSTRPYYSTRDKRLNKILKIVEELWNTSGGNQGTRSATYFIDSDGTKSGNLERLDMTAEHFDMTEDEYDD